MSAAPLEIEQRWPGPGGGGGGGGMQNVTWWNLPGAGGIGRAAAGAGKRRHRARPRLLVLSEDPGPLAALTVTLDRAFSVLRAVTISEAYEYLAGASPPAAVVVDVSPANLDVVFFIQRLRSTMPDCPVIVLSAARDQEPTGTLPALDVHGFFPRPVRINALLSRLGALLSGGGYPPAGFRALSPAVSTVIEHVAEHYASRLTVSVLARAGGISASHLAQMFSAEMGTSLKEHVTAVRVEVAKHGLRVTNDKLSQIAERSGFYDGSHLYRVFRRWAGQSPGGFRRRRLESTAGRRRAPTAEAVR